MEEPAFRTPSPTVEARRFSAARARPISGTMRQHCAAGTTVVPKNHDINASSSMTEVILAEKKYTLEMAGETLREAGARLQTLCKLSQRAKSAISVEKRTALVVMRLSAVRETTIRITRGSTMSGKWKRLPPNRKPRESTICHSDRSRTLSEVEGDGAVEEPAVGLRRLDHLGGPRSARRLRSACSVSPASNCRSAYCKIPPLP